MEYAVIKSYVSKLLFQIQTEINISNSDECIGIDRALHMMRFIRPLCDELILLDLCVMNLGSIQ